MRLLLRALQPTILAMLVVEPSTSEMLSWWHHPYMFVIVKQANGPNQRRPLSLSGHRATIDAIVGLMQAVLTPERLSPSPSHTLRPISVQEFFFFSVGHSCSLCIHLFVKMMSEQHTSSWL
jgi:hypothetical protein